MEEIRKANGVSVSIRTSPKLDLSDIPEKYHKRLRKEHECLKAFVADNKGKAVSPPCEVTGVAFPVEEDGERYYIGVCPTLGGGCLTQGETKEEVAKNLKEVAELCLEDMLELGKEERITVRLSLIVAREEQKNRGS